MKGDGQRSSAERKEMRWQSRSRVVPTCPATASSAPLEGQRPVAVDVGRGAPGGITRLLGGHGALLSGAPHVMPVWGVWADGAAWFSSSPESRKARNIAADPRAVITTDNPRQPVVVEGVVARRRATRPSSVHRRGSTPSTRRTSPWTSSPRTRASGSSLSGLRTRRSRFHRLSHPLGLRRRAPTAVLALLSVSRSWR